MPNVTATPCSEKNLSYQHQILSHTYTYILSINMTVIFSCMPSAGVIDKTDGDFLRMRLKQWMWVMIINMMRHDVDAHLQLAVDVSYTDASLRDPNARVVIPSLQFVTDPSVADDDKHRLFMWLTEAVTMFQQQNIGEHMLFVGINLNVNTHVCKQQPLQHWRQRLSIVE